MAKGSATPKRKTIFPDFFTLSGGTRKAFLLLERRIQKTVFIFAGDFLIFRQLAGGCRPERQRGRSSVLHRRKGDEEGRHPLLSGDFRLPAGGLFFFRRKMSGSQPEGYSSFVGRCPAASRRVILLSSPKEEPRKAPPFRTGGRRLGGLTPKTPAIDRRQAIPPPPAPGLTLQAG